MMITKGIMNKRVKGFLVPEEYYMRLIYPNELRYAVDLENYVYDNLPDKQVLYKDSYEEMFDDMKSGAKIIGVFNESNKMVAYRYIGFPGNSSKNLAYDINLPESEMDKVVHLETTLVHPDYRGNSLQSVTLQHAAVMVKDLGYKHLLCTVSPFNFFSLYNIMKNGLKIKALKKKYGSDGDDGLWRFILHKDMEHRYFEKLIDSHVSKLDNIDEQKSLIDNGYIGFNIFKDNKTLSYARFY